MSSLCSSSNGSSCSSDDVDQGAETHEATVHYKLRKRSRETRHKMARMARFIEEDEDYWSDSNHKQVKRKNYVRIAATKRERTRMHKLNSGYDKLRKVVPKLNCAEDSNEELSKIATLRLAIDYIDALTTCLGKLNKDGKQESRAAEKDEGTRTESSAEEDDTDILAKLIDSVIEEGGSWFWEPIKASELNRV